MSLKAHPLNSSDYNGILHQVAIKTKCLAKQELTESPDYGCEKALDKNIDRYFCSERTISSPWIIFSFPEHNIYMANYSITTFYGEACPRNFIIEGLHNDEWVLLDTVTSLELVSPVITLTRPVKTVFKTSTFRLTMTANNQNNGHYEFRIRMFDFFGVVRKIKLCTAQRKSQSISISSYLVVCLLIS